MEALRDGCSVSQQLVTERTCHARSEQVAPHAHHGLCARPLTTGPHLSVPPRSLIRPDPIRPLFTTFARERRRRARGREKPRSARIRSKGASFTRWYDAPSGGLELVVLRREMRASARAREGGGDWRTRRKRERESINNKGQRERSKKYLFCGAGYLFSFSLFA